MHYTDTYMYTHTYTAQAHTYTRHPCTPTHNTEKPPCEEGTVTKGTKIVSTFILLKKPLLGFPLGTTAQRLTWILKLGCLT